MYFVLKNSLIQNEWRDGAQYKPHNVPCTMLSQSVMNFPALLALPLPFHKKGNIKRRVRIYVYTYLTAITSKTLVVCHKKCKEGILLGTISK